MVITNISVRKLELDNGLKAIITLVIEDAIVLHDIKLIYKNDNYFLAMPSKNHNGKFMDIFHPINKVTRNMIEDLAIQAYLSLEDLKQTSVTYIIKEPASGKNLFKEYEVKTNIHNNVLEWLDGE